VVFVIVAVFFVAVLGAMVRAEMKTLERRDVNLFTRSPKNGEQNAQRTAHPQVNFHEQARKNL
jgi:hypothetical protein